MRLALVREQIDAIERTRIAQLEAAPKTGPHAMVRLLAKILGLGIETADMLVNEVLSRNLRDRRAVARYAGLTGSPDESGKKRRERDSPKPVTLASGAGWSNSLGGFCCSRKRARWYFGSGHEPKAPPGSAKPK